MTLGFCVVDGLMVCWLLVDEVWPFFKMGIHTNCFALGVIKLLVELSVIKLFNMVLKNCVQNKNITRTYYTSIHGGCCTTTDMLYDVKKKKHACTVGTAAELCNCLLYTSRCV